jgi:hypothetical protein
VNESVHLRHQLAEARELVKCTKTIYDHHFEKIEVNFSLCDLFFLIKTFFFVFSLARRIRKST